MNGFGGAGLLAGLVAFLLGIGLGTVIASGGAVTPVSMDDALQEFRSDQGAGTAPEPETRGTQQPPEPTDQPEVADRSVRGGAEAPDRDVVAPAGTPAGRAPEASGSADDPAPFDPPAPGVYRYRVRGGEELGAPGGRRTYPRESAATVRRARGCSWELEHQIAEERVERRRYCSQPDTLLYAGTRTRVTFYGTTQEGDLACDPARPLVHTDDRPGTRREATCRSDQDESHDVTTYVGLRDLDVGGARVSAHHVRVDSAFTGRAEGTSTILMWLHPETGLLLRMERRVDSHSDAFGPRVSYREEATFELVDLEPRT